MACACYNIKFLLIITGFLSSLINHLLTPRRTKELRRRVGVEGEVFYPPSHPAKI
jgi:hypothetical protein